MSESVRFDIGIDWGFGGQGIYFHGIRRQDIFWSDSRKHLDGLGIGFTDKFDRGFIGAFYYVA